VRLFFCSIFYRKLIKFEIRMTFTPHISIYLEEGRNNQWFENHIIKAIWIFSKNLEYDFKLRRKIVNIHLGEEEKDYNKSANSIKSIWIRNKINTAIEVSSLEKINQIIKIIHSTLLDIGKFEGWNIESIEKAFKRSISDNGDFVWHSEKMKANKKRTMKARIKITLENNKAEIISEIFDNAGNLQNEIKLINTFTYQVDWFGMFTKAVWIDNEKFGFSFLASQLLIFGNTTSGLSETIISNNNSTREEVEGLLRKLTYIQFDNPKEMIKWINK
jgi:hypothetical protein